MIISPHFVIILYIFEICCISVIIFANYKFTQRAPAIKSAVQNLFILMFVRLIVKMIYFYVEYYINTWPLNFLINTAMDGTYALSVLLCMKAAYVMTGRRFEGEKSLAITSAICYVAGFEIISYFWIDHSSNVNIVFSGELPRLLYFINETFFIFATFVIGVFYLADAKNRDPDTRRSLWWLMLNMLWYGVYVYTWNISFCWSGASWIRALKPLDGVLLYTLVLILFYALHYGRGSLKQETPETRQFDSQKVLDALGSEKGLSPREQEILVLLFHGVSYAEIAQQLCISINTVKRHCSNIYQKCGIKNRNQINGLVEKKMR